MDSIRKPTKEKKPVADLIAVEVRLVSFPHTGFNFLLSYTIFYACNSRGGLLPGSSMVL